MLVRPLLHGSACDSLIMRASPSLCLPLGAGLTLQSTPLGTPKVRTSHQEPLYSKETQREGEKEGCFQ